MKIHYMYDTESLQICAGRAIRPVTSFLAPWKFLFCYNCVLSGAAPFCCTPLLAESPKGNCCCGTMLRAVGSRLPGLNCEINHPQCCSRRPCTTRDESRRTGVKIRAEPIDTRVSERRSWCWRFGQMMTSGKTICHKEIIKLSESIDSCAGKYINPIPR